MTDSTERRTAQCDSLLDACTPLLYIRNAFRITGLPVDATVREIKRRTDDLKHAEELGDGASEHTSVFALNPPPTIDNIREAVQRLHDPEKRFIDEYFWFWPADFGQGYSDPVLKQIQDGNKKAAFDTWFHQEHDDNSQLRFVAAHNLAVMYHLVALDSEQVEHQFALDKQTRDTVNSYWKEAFCRWEILSDNEEYWSRINDRIRSINDARLTTGFARRMRLNLPEALDKINAELALKFSEKQKYQLAELHIRFMRDTHQGRDNVQRSLELVATPIKQRVRLCIESALKSARQTPELAHKQALSLIESVRDPLRVIDTLFTPNDHNRIELFDEVSEACITCGIEYTNKTKDWDTRHSILTKAAVFACSPNAKEKLSKSLAIVLEHQAFLKYHIPLVNKLKTLQDATDAPDATLYKVKTYILPDLVSIANSEGIETDVYKACAYSAAQTIRYLSVKIYNNTHDDNIASLLLDYACSVAIDDDQQEQFRKDKEHIERIRREEKQHNVFLKIRSDEIEVTKDCVRYNQRTLPSVDITGVRFGIYIQITNGVRSSSYHVGVLSAKHGTINIECKRMFRDEEKAEKDFQAIVMALYNQIVPGLVSRLSISIRAGHDCSIGSVRVSSNGLHMTSGALFWKKEHVITYGNVSFSNHDGMLHVSAKAQDKQLCESLSRREVWNAPILEYLVKALRSNA